MDESERGPLEEAEVVEENRRTGLFRRKPRDPLAAKSVRPLIMISAATPSRANLRELLMRL